MIINHEFKGSVANGVAVSSFYAEVARVIRYEKGSPDSALFSVSFIQQSIKNSIVQFEAFLTKDLAGLSQDKLHIYKISKLDHFALTEIYAAQY